NATVRPRAFHAGKINAEFSRDAARNRRRFYARFLGLWWPPCRLRRRHACRYRLLFLFRLRWRRFLFSLFRFRRLRFFFLLRFLRPLFFRFFCFGLFLLF